MDAIMASSVSPERLEWLVRWLFGTALRVANIIQAPALILTGGIAWLLCRPLQSWIIAWIRRLPEHQRLDWLVQHRAWLINRLVPLITPATWMMGSMQSCGVCSGCGRL